MDHDPPSKPLRIGVVLNSTGSYWMSLARGIFDTARQYQGLESILVSPHTVESSDQNPVQYGYFSACIARVNSTTLRDRLLKSPVPVVNVSGFLDTPFPSVLVDDAMVGDMAARHLVGLGLQRFVYCGDSCRFSVRREKAFAATIEALGKTYFPLFSEGSRSAHWCQRIAGILREPGAAPLGAFAVNDDSADALMARLRLNGIRVPNAVAVLGVDNEELVHRRCTPTLSSVEIPTYGIGCEAVHLAMRILRGECAAQDRNSVTLPPCRVVARVSTGVLAVADPNVLSAISFIKANSRRAIAVDEVVAAVGGTPKRTLQRHFLETLGTSMQDHIQSTRLDLSKELLADPNLSIKEVCYRGGFGGPSRFAKFFRRKEGLTPQAYRTHRLGNPGPDER